MFNKKEYFERMNLLESPSINLEGLRSLYLAHLRTFTFENIDCLLDRTIELDTSLLFEKLVVKKRGGYCFELNLFFLAALKHFGFEAEVFLARVFYRGVGVNAKTHLTVMVTLPEGKFIADAGFGGPGPEDLLKFELDTVTKIGNYNFTISKDLEFGYMIKRETAGEMKNVFAFTFDKVYPADLQMANFYVSKLPGSAFRSAFNICQFTNVGRNSIFNNQYNEFINGVQTSYPIENFENLNKLFLDKFEINLSLEELNLLNLKWNEFKL